MQMKLWHLVFVPPIFLIAMAFSNSIMEARQGNIPRHVSIPRAFSQSGVTLAQFNAIQTGMSYASVCAILGSPGTVLSTSHIDGIDGVISAQDCVMYQWMGAGMTGANMNAMFQNDRLITKAQMWLQ